MLIFIAGSTGFVGNHLLTSLKEQGVEVRCLARTTRKAEELKRMGFQAHIGDITERESLKGGLEGADIAVNLVGIIAESSGITYNAVHVEGTENLIAEAREAGVRCFFYQSALGASLEGRTAYQRTKAQAEETVRGSGIPYTIFRPSLIIGRGDGFTQRMMALIKAGPVVPVPGTGRTRLQPLYIGDWIRCFMTIIREKEFKDSTFELGGPETHSFDEILSMIMEAMGVEKRLFHIPTGILSLGAPIAGGAARLLGLDLPTVTREQLELLGEDNVCAEDSVESAFGFRPLGLREALETFIP